MPKEKSTIARNAALLVGVELICKAFEVGLAIAIANILGRGNFGLLNAAYALGGIAALLPNYGLATLTVRDVARNNSLAAAYFINGAALKMLLSVLAFGALIGFALVRGLEVSSRQIILLAAVILFSDTFLQFINSFFRAYQVMQYEALARIALSVVNVGSGLVVLLSGGGLLGLLLIRLAVYAAGLIGTFLVLLRRRLFRISWRPQMGWLWKLFKGASPLALLSIFVTIFVSIDVVMLFLMKGQEEVGLYAAATKFVIIVLLVPQGFVGAVFPAMSQLVGQSGQAMERILVSSTRHLLIMALPVVGLFIWYRQSWVGLIYDQTYAGSAAVLAVLSWSLIFDFMNHAGNRVLIAIRSERAVLVIVILAAAFNVLSNFFVIPRHGAAGAAATTVATEALVFVAQTCALAGKRLRLRILRNLSKPLLAFVVMTLTLWGLLRVKTAWYLGAPAACAAYLAVLLLVRTFSREEINLIRSMASLARQKLSRAGERKT